MTTGAAYRRKLIEVDLPLDHISKESAREKSIRHGHPSTLHLWWARRPLAACRAVIFASLVDDPSACPEEFGDEEAQRAERNRLHDLIRQLVVWENVNDTNLMEKARSEIARSVARSHGEAAPTESAAVLEYLNRQAKPIYDPFCGGGSIPLETQRLGLRAVGSDLNPVAVLITKALIELPPRFANQPPVNPDADAMGMTVGKGKQATRLPWRGAAGLADDIRYYGRRMRELAWERVGHLYPLAKLPWGGEATVIAWLWARTVPCPNPACGVAMPLMRTFQLSTKSNNQHWTKPVVDRATRSISFRVQHTAQDVPTEGTVSRKGATCVACNGTVPLEYVRAQSRAGKLGEQMTAIVAEGDRKRLFLSPTDEHVQAAMFAKPSEYSIPQQKMPTTTYKVSGRGYGVTHWHQLFSRRQLSAMTTLSESLVDVAKFLTRDGASDEYASAVCTYLALAVGREASSCSSYARWENSGDKVAGVFATQAIPMMWDFAESNPFCSATQNWMAQIEWVVEAVKKLPADVNQGRVYQADAATTIHADSGPVIVTDPPYYDNISYAELSDFFYVWLRPLLRDIYPDLFSGILVPIEEEMVAVPRFEYPRERFESLLHQTLRLIRERCSPQFPSSIFYAYKQHEEEREGRTSTGWDTMLTALVDADFEIVGTWPMRTERPARSNALSANSLASSVVLVCRPRSEEARTATRRQFLDALEAELPPALDQLTQENHIAPVDLAQAAIGPGMRIYSRYRRVETIEGEPVPVREALAAINRVIAEYDERQQGDLDSETRFCLDWLKQYGFGEGRYGEAETLARSKNVSIEDLRDAKELLLAVGGVVRLSPMDEYGSDRRVRLGEMTAWEAAFRMAYHLNREDGRRIEGAAEVARGMGSRAESVERLARILYNHYDRKNDSSNAVMFNELVAEWPSIRARMQGPDQGRMI